MTDERFYLWPSWPRSPYYELRTDGVLFGWAWAEDGEPDDESGLAFTSAADALRAAARDALVSVIGTSYRDKLIARLRAHADELEAELEAREIPLIRENIGRITELALDRGYHVTWNRQATTADRAVTLTLIPTLELDPHSALETWAGKVDEGRVVIDHGSYVSIADKARDD